MSIENQIDTIIMATRRNQVIWTEKDENTLVANRQVGTEDDKLVFPELIRIVTGDKKVVDYRIEIGNETMGHSYAPIFQFGRELFGDNIKE